jgi:hypothetical protein
VIVREGDGICTKRSMVLVKLIDTAVKSPPELDNVGATNLASQY